MKKALLDCKNILVCPECGCDLTILESKLLCSCCNREWSVDKDGVIRFLNSGYFFGASREGMNELLAEMRNMSAEQFFDSISQLESKYEDFNYSYCLDSARADWTVLGDFSQKIVVDLGCGYGAISIPLAKRAKVVISIDATLERIKFLSIIARYKGVKNIVPMHADVFKLPFKRESVNSFIMVGLLEWIGTFRQDKSPGELQQEFLKYLRNLLSENGELWIGIENRLNPLYLIGKTHHGDIPFTPLMPRFMANFIHRLFKKGGYRTWTYTKYGYQELLETSGFTDIEFFYPFLGYQLPKFISSSTKPCILASYLGNTIIPQSSLKYTFGSKVLILLGHLRLAGRFAPAFFIKAKKG
mgnify:CR=1 FL=1